MSRDPRDSREIGDDLGIRKRRQSSQTEAVLLDRNSDVSIISDKSILEIDNDNRLSTTEETTAKSCKKSHAKKLKEKKEKLSSPRSGCSRYCTGYTGHPRDEEDDSFEMTMCASEKRDKLGYRIKRSKKKLQEISNHVKRRTKQSVKKIKRMYENFNAKRAAGFRCDLRKCESRLLDCTVNECAKPNMMFSTFQKLKGKMKRDERDRRRTVCRSKSSQVETKNHDLKVLKEKSTETSVEEETSM